MRLFVLSPMMLIHLVLVACIVREPHTTPTTERTSKQEPKTADAQNSERKSAIPGSQAAACLYITNGLVANAAKFPAVVPVESDLGHCTGTFIGPNSVLTAAHCLADAQTNGGPALANLEILIGGFNGERIPVKAVYFPKWAGANQPYDNDLAVLVLEGSVAPAIMPVATARPKAGDAFTLAGYGRLLANDSSINLNPNHLLYYGQNKIVAADDELLYFLGESGTDIQSAPGQFSGTGHGDSGGPMMIGQAVAGVTNLITNLSIEYLDESIHAKMATIPTGDSLQQDIAAVFAKNLNSPQLRADIQSGRNIAGFINLNLTAPKYQSWLKSLIRHGVDIRFDTPTQTSCQ